MAGRKKLTGDAVTRQIQFRLTAEHEQIVKQFVKMLKTGALDADDFEEIKKYVEARGQQE